MNKQHSLTPEVSHILRDKGTERPGSGGYYDHQGVGTYLCRQCGLPLFRSDHKFLSGCGWPSFDDELPDAIRRQLDADGRRVEILCRRCDGHLGHVFEGEELTGKNLRHCVNSLSIEFVDSTSVVDTEEAIFAAGCFWGVEKQFAVLPGVLHTEVGYTGGHTDHPSYEAVCRGDTGHVEAVRVVYDPVQITFLELLKRFFQIHDYTQVDGQGVDRGSQYLSKIYTFDDAQAQQAKTIVAQLQQDGFCVATTIASVHIFWPAERYHQKYLLGHSGWRD